VTDPFASIPPFTEAETVLPGCWVVTGAEESGGEVLRAGLDTGSLVFDRVTGPFACPSTPPQPEHSTNL
jgi:hypothetical protein